MSFLLDYNYVRQKPTYICIASLPTAKKPIAIAAALAAAFGKT